MPAKKRAPAKKKAPANNTKTTKEKAPAKKKAPAKTKVAASNTAPATNTPKKGRGRPAKSYEMSSEAAFAKITKGRNLKKLTPEELSKYKKEAYITAKSVRDKAKREGKTAANKEIREAKKKLKAQEDAGKAERKALREKRKLEKAEKDKIKAKESGFREMTKNLDNILKSIEDPKMARQILGSLNINWQKGKGAKLAEKGSLSVRQRAALVVYNDVLKSLFGGGAKKATTTAAPTGGRQLKTVQATQARRAEKGITPIAGLGISARAEAGLGKKGPVKPLRAVLKVGRNQRTLQKMFDTIDAIAAKKGKAGTKRGKWKQATSVDDTVKQDMVKQAFARTIGDVMSGKYRGKTGSGISSYTFGNVKNIADRYFYQSYGKRGKKK